MAPNDVQLARLTAQVEALTERFDRLESMADDMHRMRSTFDQAAGGITVLKWLGFGSVGGVMAAAAAFYSWIHPIR
jgi:hypothetical protein